MPSHQPLTEQEFKTMFNLLHRYVMTEMDQWGLWKFDTEHRSITKDLTGFANLSSLEVAICSARDPLQFFHGL